MKESRQTNYQRPDGFQRSFIQSENGDFTNPQSYIPVTITGRKGVFFSSYEFDLLVIPEEDDSEIDAQKGQHQHHEWREYNRDGYNAAYKEQVDIELQGITGLFLDLHQLNSHHYADGSPD